MLYSNITIKLYSKSLGCDNWYIFMYLKGASTLHTPYRNVQKCMIGVMNRSQWLWNSLPSKCVIWAHKLLHTSTHISCKLSYSAWGCNRAYRMPRIQYSTGFQWHFHYCYGGCDIIIIYTMYWQITFICCCITITTRAYSTIHNTATKSWYSPVHNVWHNNICSLLCERIQNTTCDIIIVPPGGRRHNHLSVHYAYCMC